METKKNSGWDSPIAIHPGKFLEETLENFNMPQADLAERIGLSRKVVNEIIKGKNSITRATAFKLSKVFPLSEEYWVNIQSIYEGDKARLEEEKRIQEDIKNHFPNFKETYKELSRIGNSSGLRYTDGNAGPIVLELQKFFAADSLGYIENEIKQEEVAFRKYKSNKINQYTLAAWLRLGKIKAQKTETSTYNEQSLRSCVDGIVHLSQENPHQYLPKLEKLLADCGIVLACMPYLKNTHVQGAATWINKDKALIMLNTTKKSEDRFWFTLFHEIGHILKHGKREAFIDFEESIKNKEEDEANRFAQSCLIPNFSEVVADFNASKNQKEEIRNIAAKIKISPSIVAGRIAHELQDRQTNVYAILSNFFETKINYSNL